MSSHRSSSPARSTRPAVIHRRYRALGTSACLLLGLLFTVSSGFAQEPESTEPFFSISSQQTYAPSQQPKIWLTFRQVDRLDFRIYRVQDPVQFFSKLRDAHHFGSEKQELAREKTWLERFHAWKRDLRLSIRDFFRR
ncbi:MAG: hypothetical protein ABSA70_15615, partial [Terriglobia bacterium]